MPKRRQKNSCEKTTSTVASKKKSLKNSTLKTLTKSFKQKQKGFCYCLKKTFNEYHKKNLKKGNFDCEDGFVTDFLTKVAKKIREHILSDAKGSKAAKFPKIRDSFFQSVFNSKQNGQN